MKTIGIICEYNPFHNGHAHQLHTLAQEHPEALRICIMSGSFVQRGEPAIFLNLTVLVGLFSVVQTSLSSYLHSILWVVHNCLEQALFAW